MTRRKDAKKRSKTQLSKVDVYAKQGVSLVKPNPMSGEELRQHMIRRGGYAPAKRKDDRRGGGNRNRWN